MHEGIENMKQDTEFFLDCEASSVGIFKQSIGARNRVRIGLSYRPSRLHRLAELIHWNRFPGSLKVCKFGQRAGKAAQHGKYGRYQRTVEGGLQLSGVSNEFSAKYSREHNRRREQVGQES